MKSESALRSGTSPHAEETSVPGANPAAPVPRADAPGTAISAAHSAEASGVASTATPGPLSRSARRWIVLGILAVAIVFVLVVHSVLRPFIWAAVVAYILSPVVNLMQRRLRLRRGYC